MTNYENILNDTITAYLLTNEGFIDNDKSREIGIAQIIQHNRADNERHALQLHRSFVALGLPELNRYVSIIHEYDIHLDTYIDDIVTELYGIDEGLTYEETNHLGLSKTASRLRKRWNKQVRSIKRFFKKAIKNRVNYLKEWSKPRKVYILKATGEIHNGLWYTIKALIKSTGLITHSFKVAAEVTDED